MFMKSVGRALASGGVIARWAKLALLSGALVILFLVIHVPASVMLASMLAAIIVATNDAKLRVAPALLTVVQGVIGCLIAHAVNPEILAFILVHWAMFLATVAAVILVSALLGGLLTWFGVVPGAVAIWGSMPGASTLMTVMAEANGEDIRLVAFMQFLRFAAVAATASLAARFYGVPALLPHAAATHASHHWTGLAVTLLLAGPGAFAGRRLRIPAGACMLPLFLGMALQGAGIIQLQLPAWLLAPSYALLGWYIGLSFTAAALRYVAHAVPGVLATIAAQMALCGGIGFLLTRYANVQPLTAYLATSPGGADAIAIVAISMQGLDVSFIMALQTARVVLVSLSGPYLARFVSARCRSTGQLSRYSG